MVEQSTDKGLDLDQTTTTVAPLVKKQLIKQREGPKKYSITQVVGWKDNKHIVSCEEDDLMSVWGHKPVICILDEHYTLLRQLQLPFETRVKFGILPFPERNLLVLVHYCYIGDPVCLVVEHIYINEQDEMVVDRKHVLEVDTWYSCGNVDGRLCKISNECFCCVFGDMFNYEDCSRVLFSLDGYQKMPKLVPPGEICSSFYATETFIVSPEVYADVGNTLHINLQLPVAKQCIFAVQNYVLIYEHKYDNPTEIEAEILDMKLEEQLCLLRVNLCRAIDILHLESYRLDLLLDVGKNEIACVSGKLKSNESIHSYIKDSHSMWWPSPDIKFPDPLVTT